jgi:hypothetical protein
MEEENSSKKVSKLFLYNVMLGMLLFGTAGTINGKYLDEATSPKIPTDEGCYNFSHPYF